jgi:hypothetical protein
VSTDLAPRIAATLDELVGAATDRVEVRTADAKSGAYFERLRIDGVPHFLKVLSDGDDWIMRVTGNDSHWEFKAWQAGIYAEMPSVIDHTVVGMALEQDAGPARLSILMVDCAADLVPFGDDPVPALHHAGWIVWVPETRRRAATW